MQTQESTSMKLVRRRKFSAPAGNESGYIVIADLFRLLISTAVASAAELEEVAWLDPVNPVSIELAPLTSDCLLRQARPAG